jgi:hypothetical protein
MVQVDVFWSYGIGAGFAVAAHRQLAAEKKENPDATMFKSPFFTHTLLFLSACFAPSGVCLLWAFTNWETMHVFSYDTLPAWLVTIFAVTNVTQGILGYWVARKLILIGKTYLATLQILLGYFLMFFILVHGWDGTGYMRFFSYDRGLFMTWGERAPLSNIITWLTCPVALTLMAMGVVLIPWIVGLAGKWTVEGYKIGGGAKPPKLPSLAFVYISFLAMVFVFALGSAILSSLLIRYTGWIPGIALFAVLAYLALYRNGGLFHRYTQRVILP